jgi:hypothetical protein
MTLDTNERLAKVYIPLLNEGTTVSRPTMAEVLGDNIYRVLATPDYDPELETWEYPPGSIVRCRKGAWKEHEILIASEIYRGPHISGR